MPYPGLLQPEPLPLQHSTADSYLLRRHPNTVLSQSLWGLWVLVHTRYVWALWASLAGMGFGSKCDFCPSYHLAGASLTLGHGVFPHSHSSTTQLWLECHCKFITFVFFPSLLRYNWYLSKPCASHCNIVSVQGCWFDHLLIWSTWFDHLHITYHMVKLPSHHIVTISFLWWEHLLTTFMLLSVITVMCIISPELIS